MNLIIGFIGAVLVILGMMNLLEIISGHVKKGKSKSESVVLTDMYGDIRDLTETVPKVTRENIMNGTIAITFAIGKMDYALGACDLLGIDKTPITRGGGATMFRIENGKAVESKDPKYYITTHFLSNMLKDHKLLSGVEDGDVAISLRTDRYYVFTSNGDKTMASDVLEFNRYFETDISDTISDKEFEWAQIRNRKAIGHKKCPNNVKVDTVANVARAIRNVEMFEGK